MELIFDGDHMPAENVIAHMKKAFEQALEFEKVYNSDLEVSITFVDAPEIKELNNIYRDVDKITDVLSFPQFESCEDIPESGVTTIGDVVICTEQALLQADEYGHSSERELVYLFVHSIFHLLGHDHMEDREKSAMRLAEETIMDKIGLIR